MAIARIRKNDTVIVVSGNDAGKTGTVVRVDPKKGVAVVGGMTFATLCGLLLIPAFYIISEKMARNFWKATGLKRIKFKYRMLRR